jgi:hypothetical protein
MTAQTLDVATLTEQVNRAIVVGSVTSIVVHPDTGLVLVSVALPDLPEVERLRAEERARVSLLVVEARYAAGGYVFAPVFAPGFAPGVDHPRDARPASPGTP